MEVGGDVSLITAHSGLEQTKLVQKPYFWLALHRTKVRWRFRKILWPSQNIFNQILTELIFMILTVRTGGLVKKIVKVMSVKLHTRKQFALCCCIFTKISTLIEIWNSTHCGKNSARLTQSRNQNWPTQTTM